MVRKVCLVGTVAAALVAVGAYMGGATSADAKPKEEAKPPAPLRAGYVAMSEVMGQSKMWQAKAKMAQARREAAAKKLTALREEVQILQVKAQSAVGDEQAKLTKDVVASARKFEDAERTMREEVDKVAQTALTEMHSSFAREIRAMAKERQLDVVYAHPANLEKAFADGPKSQAMLDIYFRPPALTPVYLRGELDLTGDLIERLDARFEKEEKKADDE